MNSPALLQTLSRLFHLVYFVKCWQMVLELNSKRLYQSSGKEKKVVVLYVFPSSTKREFRHFHVVVGQRRQRNVQKSVMHVQSCCFANLNLLLFCRSRCRCPRRCLSSPLFTDNPWAFVFIISYMMSVVFSILQYEVVQSLRSSWSCWCAPTVSPVACNSDPSCSESWIALSAG